MAVEDGSDCCFERGNERFRFRVGALIIENGCALFATNDVCGHYYSIGGGVRLGETSEAAVCREVREETGVNYGIDRLVFVNENFFRPLSGCFNGVNCHEISFYYLMKPRGTCEVHSGSVCPDGREYVRWIPLDKLNEVKVLPDFLTSRLHDLPSSVEKIITGTAFRA